MRRPWIDLALVAAAFAVAAALYPRLPDPVPVHWNLRGAPNGFMRLPWGAFVLPLLMTGVWALGSLPRLWSTERRDERLARAYAMVRTATLAFLLLVTALALLAASGAPIALPRALASGVGLLFVVLGLYLGELPRNRFIGIRTRATLASDEVWRRTNRLGGRLFVACGAVATILGLACASPLPALLVTMPAALVPIYYARVLYRRIEGGE